MKRHKSLQPLSRFHHKGLILAQAIRKDTPSLKNIPSSFAGQIEYTHRFFHDELKPHFSIEENQLYSNFRHLDQNIEQLFQQLFEEHQQIAEWVEQLPNAGDQEKLLDQIGHLLKNHIRKEERQLFQQIQQLADEEMLRKFGELL